jgi:murein DD-endopeptidase MepM/ murein hydrolase activator NlpD
MRFKGFVRQIIAVLTILVAISIVAPEVFAQKKKPTPAKKSSSKKAPTKKKAPVKKKTSSSKKPASKKKKGSKKKKSKRGRKPVRSIYYNPIPDPIILSEKTWISTPALPLDSANTITNSLLTTDSIYTKDWVNAITFVYDSVEFNDLPEEIYLPLINKDEKFSLTWYGKINSEYGKRWGRQHHGLDVDLNIGDTVIAAFDGVVRYAQFNKSGFGNCVVIRHKNGLETIYGHLCKIDVVENQYVKSGQHIGLGGTSGHSTGPHLHFEMRYKDYSFDPQLLIDLSTQQLKTETVIFDKVDLVNYRYPTFSPNIDELEKKPVSKSKKSKKGKKTSSKKKKPVKKSAKKKTTPTKKKTAKKPVSKKAPVKKAPAKKAPAKKKR